MLNTRRSTLLASVVDHSIQVIDLLDEIFPDVDYPSQEWIQKLNDPRFKIQTHYVLDKYISSLNQHMMAVNKAVFAAHKKEDGRQDTIDADTNLLVLRKFYLVGRSMDELDKMYVKVSLLDSVLRKCKEEYTALRYQISSLLTAIKYERKQQENLLINSMPKQNIAEKFRAMEERDQKIIENIIRELNRTEDHLEKSVLDVKYDIHGDKAKLSNLNDDLKKILVDKKFSKKDSVKNLYNLYDKIMRLDDAVGIKYNLLLLALINTMGATSQKAFAKSSTLFSPSTLRIAIDKIIAKAILPEAIINAAVKNRVISLDADKAEEKRIRESICEEYRNEGVAEVMARLFGQSKSEGAKKIYFTLMQDFIKIKKFPELKHDILKKLQEQNVLSLYSDKLLPREFQTTANISSLPKK